MDALASLHRDWVQQPGGFSGAETTLTAASAHDDRDLPPLAPPALAPDAPGLPADGSAAWHCLVRFRPDGKLTGFQHAFVLPTTIERVR